MRILKQNIKNSLKTNVIFFFRLKITALVTKNFPDVVVVGVFVVKYLGECPLKLLEQVWGGHVLGVLVGMETVHRVDYLVVLPPERLPSLDHCDVIKNCENPQKKRVLF